MKKQHFTTYHTKERGTSLIGDSLRQKSFPSAGGAVEDDTLGGLDAHLLIVLGVGQGKLHRLLEKK